MSTEIKSFSDIIPEDYRFINPIAIIVFVTPKDNPRNCRYRNSGKILLASRQYPKHK